MLRHDHEANHVEVVPSAHLLEDFKDGVTCTGSAEQRLASIATRSDEMKVAATMEAR